jgi:oligoendopeptidase F
MDAFQHWAYTNPDVAVDAAASSAKWAELWLRFMPGVDWSGLEEELAMSWQSIPHFFGWPLSGTEYAVAQMGAVQLWRNALSDGTGALTRFREALSLGNTVPLPELYRVAGAELAFDSVTLREAVALMEHTISTLGDKV